MATAHATWNAKSGITECDWCDGTGRIDSQRRGTIDDPYPSVACDWCDGDIPECSVCGYTTDVKGFDCLACYTIYNIEDDQLASFDMDEFAAALRMALEVARKAAGK